MKAVHTHTKKNNSMPEKSDTISCPFYPTLGKQFSLLVFGLSLLSFFLAINEVRCIYYFFFFLTEQAIY